MDRSRVCADHRGCLAQQRGKLAQVRVWRDVAADRIGKMPFAGAPGDDRAPRITIDDRPEAGR